MNLESDTWDVITSYFRDVPNYLVRHHIDSFNDFIHNKIPLIMKNLGKSPPYVLLDKEDKNITYEIQVHYGGKTNDRYKITRPTIVSYPSGDVRQLFPNEARLKDITYGADFFFDVDIEYTMRRGDKIILDKVPSPHSAGLKNIYLGKIPIMLRSDLCVLSTADGELLTQMGEDKYDLGGYFILDGAEKVIVSQERKAENIVFLNTINQSSGNEKYTHTAEIKCVSDEAFANARTVRVQLETKGQITVRLGQERPLLKENNKRDVPLFIMFRALGIESDREILQYIIGDLNGELSEKMMDLLRPSILDPFILEDEIYDKERAEAYLVKLPSRAQQSDKKDGNNFSEILKNKKTLLSVLYSTFQEAFFPHIASTTGNINKAKAYYLGYVTRRLLLLRLGLVKDTDRDNFTNKRIDISGFLLSTLFRDAFQQLIRSVRVETNRIYTFNSKEYSGEDHIIDIINETNIQQIFNRDIFKTHFNGALKVGTIGQKKGIVQALDRITRNLTIAHLRRIIDNVGDGRVSIPRRRLHASQYGCVCPVETPEGQKVGLNKGLALVSHITFGNLAKPIINFLIEEGVEVLDDLIPTEVQSLCKVFVNGNWIGCHRNPEDLNNLFKLYRRNGLINIFISITWERSTNEIHVFTDGGRFVRPLYIVEDNNILIQPRHIRELKVGNLTFTDLVSGFRKRKDVYNYYDSSVKSLNIIGLDKSDALYQNKLRETQSIIEYIDCQAFDTTLLSIGFNIDSNSLQRITHAELHPSMFLSFNAHLLPFSEHNLSARTIFASKYVKQGISTYAMNFNSRIDTSAHLLNYPQRPLAQSRLQNHINHDVLGQGNNIFVAIASYNYNQEDAIVGNQSAVDMGLFHTTYYKQYSDMEITDPKTGEENRFYNPLYKHEMIHYPESLDALNRKNYNKLDKWGFPKKGEFLESNDIVICKYTKNKDETGADDYRDMSTSTKVGNEGSFVDAVYTWQTNPEGDRAVKVRTCQNRPPVIGDKFASRCAQKGTFGITLQRQDLPYTEDGIIPDFVLDPGSYPKRMTVSQFIEILFGNMAAELGFIGSFNAFEIINTDQINHIMENTLGFTSYGDRILYNGYTGEQMDVKIFSGCIHYQRLKYMVDDKINTRLSGHRENGVPVPGGLYTVRERQSVAGRANGGGLKFGEMERDALIAHGIWGFIKESYIERCDKFIIQVSRKSGDISIANPEIGLYYDNTSDGVVSYQLEEGSGSKGLTPNSIIGLNMYNQKTMDFIQLVVPYTFKLLIQEMEGMMIKVRFDVSRLRNIIPEVDVNEIVELSEDLIDDLMDTEQQNHEMEDSDYEMELEDDQDGGGDDQESGDQESGDEYIEPISEPDAPEDDTMKSEDNAGQVPMQPNITSTIPNNQMTTNTMSTNPIIPVNGQSASIPSANMQSSSIPMTQMQSTPNMSSISSGNNGQLLADALSVSQSGGDSNMDIDLSSYGGVKPDFDIIEREDEKSIENLNAKLLGIQTGGQDDILQMANAQGVNNVLENHSSSMQTSNSNSVQENTTNPNIPNNTYKGLNFSFGQEQTEARPQLTQINPIAQPMQQAGGFDNRKQVSFNNDIKVIELDTKISEGFLYSGSKNLDPFSQ